MRRSLLRSSRAALAAAVILLLAGCGARHQKPVENLGGRGDVSRFNLTSLKGTRDGDRLDLRVLYGDGAAELVLELHFRVGVPTRLESGTWRGLGEQGTVRERSSTFLGGQSGPPSIGGRFDLPGPDGADRYRVTIPTQELKERL